MVKRIGPVGMKNWDNERQRWIGTIVEANEETCEITVLDVDSAATQVEIDDWIKRALKEKRWKVNDSQAPSRPSADGGGI
jgi:hypothetical protein